VATETGFARRVLLVEDEQFTRALISSFLTQAGFEVMSCGTASEAVDLVDAFDPDAMVVDISLGDGPTGLDLIQALNNSQPHLAFVVLSNYGAAPAQIKTLPKVAFLQKRQVGDPNVLLEALDSMLADTDPSSSFPIALPSQVAHLTKQQLEVLEWLARGLSNKEIANRRGTTLQSTEQLIGRIYKTLGLARGDGNSMRVQATSMYSKLLGKSV
jgi:DNA-binding NarL/FixJ family response regulator